jgi:anti-sigma regulatory factor (Ser/Thr protein kinase)
MVGPEQDAGRGETARPPGGGRRPVGLRLRVRASVTAPAQARHALRRLGLPPAVANDGELLVSELVTNSVRHAGLGLDDPIQVTAVWSGTRLTVHVRDRDRSRRPGVAAGSIRPPPGAESGWGLYLVDRLASRWGTEPGGYRFELRHDRPRPAGPAQAHDRGRRS